MAYGDTFSSVQDAALREKAMRDDNLRAAFGRMMAVRQMDQQFNLSQQQLALEHEKLKASTIAAAMSHDQAIRHNDILEKQVNGYFDLQKRAVDRQHEADDNLGQTIANNIHELSGEAESSLKAYQDAQSHYRNLERNTDYLVRQGVMTRDKTSGLFIPTKPENAASAEYANKRLTEAATALDSTKKKYDFDALNHGHAVNFATQKNFMIDHKSGDVIDMTRGKRFAPAIPQEASNGDTNETNNIGYELPTDVSGATTTTNTGNEGGFPVDSGNTDYAPANPGTQNSGVILRDKATGRKFSYGGDAKEVPTNIFDIVQ